ncbi:MAG: hypothetical protein AAGE59_10330 [Cyanobacteria bacterium P01_F01_bin.86]
MLPVPTHKALSEHQRLMYMAKEYERRGYRVSLYPTDEVLPESLQGFLVGLIAESNDKLVVGDVRTREHLTLNGAKDLRAIARRVEKIPNSYFDLVVTNPAPTQQADTH